MEILEFTKKVREPNLSNIKKRKPNCFGQKRFFEKDDEISCMPCRSYEECGAKLGIEVPERKPEVEEIPKEVTPRLKLDPDTKELLRKHKIPFCFGDENHRDETYCSGCNVPEYCLKACEEDPSQVVAEYIAEDKIRAITAELKNLSETGYVKNDTTVDDFLPEKKGKKAKPKKKLTAEERQQKMDEHYVLNDVDMAFHLVPLVRDRVLSKKAFVAYYLIPTYFNTKGSWRLKESTIAKLVGVKQKGVEPILKELEEHSDLKYWVWRKADRHIRGRVAERGLNENIIYDPSYKLWRKGGNMINKTNKTTKDKGKKKKLLFEFSNKMRTYGLFKNLMPSSQCLYILLLAFRAELKWTETEEEWSFREYDVAVIDKPIIREMIGISRTSYKKAVDQLIAEKLIRRPEIRHHPNSRTDEFEILLWRNAN